jgi:hypothetical protein
MRTLKSKRDAEMKEDPGKHYRFTHRVKVTVDDAERGFVQVKLDPFRIAQVYAVASFPLQTVLKKVLCAGNRGHKDYEQDIKDCICALQRELEIIEEDSWQ